MGVWQALGPPSGWVNVGLEWELSAWFPEFIPFGSLASHGGIFPCEWRMKDAGIRRKLSHRDGWPRSPHGAGR